MDRRAESIRGLMKLKVLTHKLRQCLSPSEFKRSDVNEVEDGEMEGEMVPNDVKKGHFAVVAAKGREPKRFIVELSNLSNPAFITILERAKEEYGFQQKGALAVPCPPAELQNILQCQRNRKISADGKTTPGFSLKMFQYVFFKVASPSQYLFFCSQDR